MKSLAPLACKGKRGLVVGIANKSSIAAGCARAFVAAGATLAATYLNDKALPYVRPVTELARLQAAAALRCRRARASWRLSSNESASSGANWIFCCTRSLLRPPRICTAAWWIAAPRGSAMAMDVSCHSFLRMAHLAEPLMTNGGCLLTVTFYGSERVVANYNLMGPVKAALESAVRYTAAELGAKGIRANAISPGAIHTRAASGIAHFDEMLAAEAAAAPEHQLVDIEDVGALAAFLVSDGARRITGTIIPVDGGQHAIA